MGGNSLRDEGTIAVCNVLQQSKVSKLEELHIYSNGIGADGAKAVAAFCAVSASLTRADVRYNNLEDDDKSALRAAVQGKEGFELLL